MRKTTSMKLNPEIWKNAKIDSIKLDISYSDYVEEALVEKLRKRK